MIDNRNLDMYSEDEFSDADMVSVDTLLTHPLDEKVPVDRRVTTLEKTLSEAIAIIKAQQSRIRRLEIRIGQSNNIVTKRLSDLESRFKGLRDY